MKAALYLTAVVCFAASLLCFGLAMEMRANLPLPQLANAYVQMRIETNFLHSAVLFGVGILCCFFVALINRLNRLVDLGEMVALRPAVTWPAPPVAEGRGEPKPGRERL